MWICDLYTNSPSQVALVVKNLPANAGDARDMRATPGLRRPPQGGNGNPLQYSCLENPMDRRAWRATVHGAEKSGTRLSADTQTQLHSQGSVSLYLQISLSLDEEISGLTDEEIFSSGQSPLFSESLQLTCLSVAWTLQNLPPTALLVHFLKHKCDCAIPGLKSFMAFSVPSTESSDSLERHARAQASPRSPAR